MKKTILIFSSLALVALMLTPTHHAHAVAKAVFPDSRDNQPLPPDIYPNISHNVQSSDQVAPGVTVMPEIPKDMTGAEATQPTTPEKSSSHAAWWLVGIVAVIIGIAIARKKKDTF